jgi:hypothetical protein
MSQQLHRPETTGRRKQLALIAHDNRKVDLLDWARFNRDTLARHDLHATGTTGALIADELGLIVNRFLSGPLGGDQQVGAAIAEGRVDLQQGDRRLRAVESAHGRGVRPHVRVAPYTGERGSSQDRLGGWKRGSPLPACPARGRPAMSTNVFPVP